MRTNTLASVATAVTLCLSTLVRPDWRLAVRPEVRRIPRRRTLAALAVRRQPIFPETPTAVPLPTLSAEVTGPGPMFDSSPSLAPGKGLAAFNYETHEYFVSGTANGEPYTTRLVVRKPADNSKFSGLVLAEAMHGSGAAHMFEFTSIYTMSSGHAAVEILTTPPAQFVALNEARYRTSN
jgi:hypothetical protein